MVLNVYERLILERVKNEGIEKINDFLFHNSNYTVELLKEIDNLGYIDKCNNRFYLDRIYYQDKEYISNFTPYNLLNLENYENLSHENLSEENYNQLSYCDDISIELMRNSNFEKYIHVLIINNTNVKEEVVKYIFDNISDIKKLYFNDVLNNLIYISYMSYTHIFRRIRRGIEFYRVNDCKFMDYEYVKNHKYKDDLIICFFRFSNKLSEKIIEENFFKYKYIFFRNKYIDINILFNLIMKNDCSNILFQLYERDDCSLDMYKDICNKYKSNFYHYYYENYRRDKRSICEENYFNNYLSKNSEFEKVVPLLNIDMSILLYDKNYSDILCKGQLDIFKYMEIFFHNSINEKVIRDNIEIVRYISNNIIDVGNLLSKNINFSRRFILEYFPNKNYDENYSEYEKNSVIYIWKYSMSYKHTINRVLKDLHKGIHKIKFRNKINEELISKACSPKRMYNWNEYACEEFPEEYAKECEKYKYM